MFNEDWDALVYAARGSLEVELTNRTWIVPPHRAVMVPSHADLRVTSVGKTAIRCVYLRPQRRTSLGRDATVLEVSPLAREIIVAIGAEGVLWRNRPSHVRLLGVLFDQLRPAPITPFTLPWPSTAEAQAAAQILLNTHEPIDPERLAAQLGHSRRTLERRFVEETGMSLGRWRQCVMLRNGMRSLAAGSTVQSAALEAGYATPSGFIAAFRRTFGISPKAYFGAGSPPRDE